MIACNDVHIFQDTTKAGVTTTTIQAMVETTTIKVMAVMATTTTATTTVKDTVKAGATKAVITATKGGTDMEVTTRGSRVSYCCLHIAGQIYCSNVFLMASRDALNNYVAIPIFKFITAFMCFIHSYNFFIFLKVMITVDGDMATTIKEVSLPSPCHLQYFLCPTSCHRT